MNAFAAFSPGLETCRFADVPNPQATAGCVLVKLEASALNHLDLWIAQGHPSYGMRTYPHVLGSDGAGTVVTPGPLEGKRVAVFSGIHCGHCPSCKAGLAGSCDSGQTIGVQRWGTHAEYVAVPEQNAVPTTLEADEAACLSVAAVTAWHMLKQAGVTKGQTVLIWGAASGVGSFAIQMARHFGAYVITTASGDKVGKAEKQFNVPIIDYKTEDVAGRVKELTGGNGADVVMEIVGPATWKSSMDSVRKGGTIVSCGAVSGPDVTLPLRELYSRQIRIIGARHGSLDEFNEVLRMAEEGKIRPVIESRFPLSETKGAFDQLARGEGFGKTVLTR